jgi:hypothetical protein
LEEYYEKYQKAKGNNSEQQKIANQFIWEVLSPPPLLFPIPTGD